MEYSAIWLVKDHRPNAQESGRIAGQICSAHFSGDQHAPQGASSWNPGSETWGAEPESRQVGRKRWMGSLGLDGWHLGRAKQANTAPWPLKAGASSMELT